MKKIAIDTETTGLRPWHGNHPYLIGVSTDDGKDVCLRWRVDPQTREVLYKEDPPQWLVDALLNTSVEKVFFNAPFDIRMMEQGLGLETRGPVHDVMLSAHVFNNLETSRGLKPLAQKYLGISKEDEDDLHTATVEARKKGKQKDWMLGPKVQADYWMVYELWQKELDAKYCLTDVERTAMLHLFHMEQMEEEGLMEVYRREMQLQRVVYQMETWGMYLRIDVAQEEREACKERAEQSLEDLREMAGNPDLNPRSPKQLREFLFGKLDLPVKKYTNTGKPSTARDAFEGIDHPALDLLTHYKLDYRSVSTFYDKYLEVALPIDGGPGAVVHADLRQCGARTGRFSCRNPNLQNAPNTYLVRSELASHVRRPFGPRPEHAWWLMDYGQLELRLFVDAAQVEPLLEVFHTGADPHKATANSIWGGEGNPLGIRAAINVMKLDTNEQVSDKIEEARQTAYRHLGRAFGGPELRRYSVWWNSVFPRQLKKSGRVGLAAVVEQCYPVDWEDGKLVLSGPEYELNLLQKKYRKVLQKELGVGLRFLSDVSNLDSELVAAAWLDYYDWDVVAAERSCLKKSVCRERTKTLSYAKQYGGGVQTIAEAIKIPRYEAEQFLAAYSQSYPRIDAYAEELMSEASRVGYITNPYGRRLNIPQDKLYVAMNYMIQSTAADLLKVAMIRIQKYADKHELRGNVVLNLHDELIMEWHQSTNLRHLRVMKKIMECHDGRLAVNLPVDVEYTTENWETKQEIQL